MIKNSFVLAVALAALILTGCASITQGTEDSIYVDISNCSETVKCTATNKKGTWEFTAPGSVRFQKSDNALHIACEDEDSVASATVTPTSGEMVWGNIIFGGIVGAAVDASSDAHWTTQDSITVHRETCRGKLLQLKQWV